MKRNILMSLPSSLLDQRFQLIEFFLTEVVGVEINCGSHGVGDRPLEKRLHQVT